MRRCLLGAAAVAALILPLRAAAAPMSLALTPNDMLAQTHSHAIILTITGTFRQLSGRLNFDPVAMTCDIDVTFVVDSLQMPNALIQSQTMSPGFLDPAEYPTQHYQGVCNGNQLVGYLTMRGQTHPFNMVITRRFSGGTLIGLHLEGVLDRHDWGLNGLSLTVGKMIRVTNDIALNGQPP